MSAIKPRLSLLLVSARSAFAQIACKQSPTNFVALINGKNFTG